MKNIVRALVLAIAVIGFAADHAITAQAKVTNPAAPVVNHVTGPRAPTCAPDNGAACGWGSWTSVGW